jgi:hypothetical protein
MRGLTCIAQNAQLSVPVHSAWFTDGISCEMSYVLGPRLGSGSVGDVHKG